MESRRLKPLNPMHGAAHRRLTLAPVAKPGAAAAHDVTCIQAEDPSAAAAGSADELEEDDAGTHANADQANLARDWRAVVSL
jgi:hypothetical protein